ncbi:glycosyltransferase [Mycetocola zhadangensis]|uniref:Glycosyltransferase n=1 Tax=Mycetocola zhadangensis TaxID=1164595 RepID=A0A3L7ITR3_9MICO|nr:glycosyltransferase [Mycetocola zhadangensis]RLQ81540.1 glycosyltransferase [Mycetocola zhadangensis]RLQ82494.1 glycosyltransferase [Mycetocola zhadangensis]GGF00787.1 glycosyl hydrolase [Mycetocola zhadangensis]
MADLPPFSLLIPVYYGDSPEFLRHAMYSTVQHQTVRPSEVILVQDGPVREAMAKTIQALIDECPVPMLHVDLPVNSGLSTALDRGLEMCRFDIVARMDADDLSAPNRFEKQLARIADGYELVGSGMYEFEADDDGQIRDGIQRIPPGTPDEIATYARFHDPFNHPTVVYSRKAVARAGGYQQLGLMEDYWLFARMIASGARVCNIREPLVRYRISSGAYTRRGGLRLLRSEVQLQTAFLRVGFTTPPQFVRNILVRGLYRLTPELIRRVSYRRLILARRGDPTQKIRFGDEASGDPSLSPNETPKN